MTNTKFRKRALLSSVAMLLVALVALGSATFAWFSTSTISDASALTAGTSQSSNLLIKEWSTDDWASNVTFVETKTANATESLGQGYLGSANMTPVSIPVPSITPADWYKATAAKLNDGYASANPTADIGAFTDQVAVVPLNVKYGTTSGSKSGNAIKTVQLTVTGLESSKNVLDYLRVGIICADETAPTGFTAQVLGNAEDDFAKDATNRNTWVKGADPFTPPTPSSSTSAVTGALTSTVNLGNYALNESHLYYLFVWFEGTDDDCTDANTGNSYGNIGFHLSAVNIGG